MRKLKFALLILLVALGCQSLRAQNRHIPFVSTNALDWAYLGGINVTTGVNLSQYVTLEVGGVYNPFSISTEGNELKNKQMTGFAAVKFWPWYVYSGWWFGVKVQYKDYSKTSIFKNTIEDGKAVGAGLSLGYSFMLSRNFNLDFGVGIWGGRKFDYSLYSKSWGSPLLESGSKFFFDADKISVALVYLF